MHPALTYVGYFLMVALIVFLSMKLGKYVDVIDAKSNISGAFIGGIMLAAVTSLPELFTAISSVLIVQNNELVIGDILGSDLINLAFFGIILLIFGKGLRSKKFNKFYYTGLMVALIMYGLVAVGLYLGKYIQIGWYTLISPVIFVFYIIFVKKTPKTAEAEGGQDDPKLTLKNAVIRFLICSVILIAASIAMTYFTDSVSKMLGMGGSFAGALFLGIATSLPELISSSTLCYRGNYNAAAGNIVGSNVFNFMILFVADTFAAIPGQTEIYIVNKDSQWLLILGVIATFAAFTMMALKNRKKQSLGNFVGVQTLNAVPPVLYVIYLLIASGIILVP